MALIIGVVACVCPCVYVCVSGVSVECTAGGWASAFAGAWLAMPMMPLRRRRRRGQLVVVGVVVVVVLALYLALGRWSCYLRGIKPLLVPTVGVISSSTSSGK